MKDFLSTTFLLFIVLDPLALSVMMPSLLRMVPPERRSRVIIREMLFGLALLLLFLFAGDKVLAFFGLDPSTLSISGGIVLFLIALGMIFPGIAAMTNAMPDVAARETEPFIVPIAIPMFAGPSSLAIVMLNGSKFLHTPNFFSFTASLITAWAASLAILLLAPQIVKRLGRRGSIALERFVGVLLILISVQMILGGFSDYMKSLKSPVPASEQVLSAVPAELSPDN
ncbi:MAG: hypothetical protein IJN19_07765 [Opitutales bacterium]|nr:hypothetical protein [Opitutales bacterium]